MNHTDLATGILLATLVVLFFIGLSILLLVTLHTRRLRHQAQLAQAERLREQEVVRAEREAVQHTLHELGRELHDNVAQLLSVAQLGLNNVLHEGATDERLVAARDALDLGIEEVRRLAHGLNTDVWHQRALADVISAEAERLERVGRLRAHVLVHGPAPALSADDTLVLFRVFQEVVHNAIKHSGADTLTIRLHGGPPCALVVADNGRGFDPSTTTASAGLAGIARRCALIGFSATCHSAPGQGCTWTLQQHPDHGTPRGPGG